MEKGWKEQLPTGANTRTTRLIVPQLNLRALTIGQNGYGVEARGAGGGGVPNKCLYGETLPRGPTPYPFI